MREESAQDGALMLRDAALRAAPQHEGITIARVGGPAKPGLWLFPVFVLFRPVIGGKASRPKKRRRRVFPLLIRWLRGKDETPGCSRPPVFFLLFTGKYRRRRAAGVAFARC